MDGTLIDTERALLGSLQKLLKEEYGRSYDDEELEFVLGVPGVASLVKLGFKDAEEANKKWNLYIKDFYHTVKVFDDIEAVLRKLKASGIVTGIVTSKTRKELIDDFVPYGLSGYLSFVICADDTKKHKPCPDPLFKFLEITGAKSEQSIYIGDTIYDMQCARDAGVDFGLALWGARDVNLLTANYKLSNPFELMHLLNLT